MDLNFPIGKGKEDLIGHKYLPKVRRDFPNVKIVVVTRFGPESYEIIVKCFRRSLADDWINIKTRGNEKTIDSSFAREFKVRIESILRPFGKYSDRGIWILQLSDLHFGNSEKFDFWGFAEDGMLYNAIKDDIFLKIPDEYEEFGGKPDIVIFNGDVTNNATDEQYRKVIEFINEFDSEVLTHTRMKDNEKSQIIIIPGNHDVNYDISRSRCIQLNSGSSKKKPSMSLKKINSEEKVEERLKYLKKYMWVPFERFLKGLKLPNPDYSELWNVESSFEAAIWEYSDIGLILIGLNSSANSEGHFNNTPSIEPRLLPNLSKVLENSDVKEIFPRLILVHHSLGSGATDTEKVDSNHLPILRKGLLDYLNGTVYLTGHTHQESVETITVDGKNLLVIGAGSSSVDAKDKPKHKPLSYNLIHLIPASSSLSNRMRVDIYRRTLEDMEFGAYRKRAKSSFEWGNNGWSDISE